MNPMDATDEQRWDAVVRRDRRADGGFLYAVRTTGVFCRPSCPSRLPNRENVAFFGSVDDAERAGFRACKRCGARPAVAGSTGREAVVRACAMIEAADAPPSLGELALAVGLSPHHFHRVFKQAVGVTPRAFAASIRAGRLRQGLASGATVTRAIHAAGFGSSGRCHEVAGDELGMTPGEYKKGGAGRSIRLAVARCRLGWLAVAATDRGVCLIEFGDSPDDLRAGLTSRFPGADAIEADPEFDGWVGRVVASIEAPGLGLDLPMDIQGTAFQRRVWEALRAIPAGSTATYAEVARRVGVPDAVRAVAGACAANKLALAIPCHRVVRTGGGLGGYRWGMDRKRRLLDREAGRPDEPGEGA